jgi:hypothetical protein
MIVVFKTGAPPKSVAGPDLARSVGHAMSRQLNAADILICFITIIKYNIKARRSAEPFVSGASLKR